MLNKKEIEEAKAHLKWILDSGILASEDEQPIENILKYIKRLETALENSIPKETIEKFIEEKAQTDTYNFKTIEVDKLQKLLGKN